MTITEREAVSEILHGLSQPLTALEVGLEVGLRNDRTAEEFRERMQKLLVIAQTLHGRLVELRTLRDLEDSRLR